MTDLALPNAPDHQQLDVSGQDQAIARLAAWTDMARAAHQIAVSLVKTTFVPQHYRDKPHEAAAAIMAGAEIGIPGPLAALRAFHPIAGTPTLSALAMRGIVQAHGHDVRIVHSDDQSAEVATRRRDDTEWQTCVWTIERAEQAGYPAKNPNWKKDPKAMLIARATAEGCRWVASDALMGMPYSAEEMQDHPEPPPPARGVARVTPQEILGRPEPAATEDGDWPEPATPGGEQQ